MNIWIVNPFDQLPNETDVPLRYWSLCREMAKQGHQVVWWSSDFSHLTKSKRSPAPHTENFQIKLIKTPPYSKNIGLARLRNHREFASQWEKQAREHFKSNSAARPQRILISLPPLGIAESAYRIRTEINQSLANSSEMKSEVILDIMDAWPETFYRALPSPFRSALGPLLMKPLHRSASRAYAGADKISAVGQSYLDLAQNYRAQAPRLQNKDALLHLCYHGTDLVRFPEKNSRKSTNNPPKIVYLGAMGSGYDLETMLKVAQQWKETDQFPGQFHFAGDGPQKAYLEALASHAGLLEDDSIPPRVVFHGYLGRDGITHLLTEAEIGIVANRPETKVACPYKAGEYAAAGLPIISCLRGELQEVLSHWDAGKHYRENSASDLEKALLPLLNDPNLRFKMGQNARQLAIELFDRNKTYRKLSKFILG